MSLISLAQHFIAGFTLFAFFLTADQWRMWVLVLLTASGFEFFQWAAETPSSKNAVNVANDILYTLFGAAVVAVLLTRKQQTDEKH